LTGEQMQDVIERWLEAWNAHDPQRVASMYIEDAISRDMGRDMALMGREAIAESLSTYMEAFPDITWKVSRFGVDTERRTVYLEWHAVGTHEGPYHGMPPTGRSVEVDGCIVFNLASDGKIVSDIGYWDVASMLRQLGLMPAWSAEGAPAT
jgi:steroid delta-isomerase-like uncharacterized protein